MPGVLLHTPPALFLLHAPETTANRPGLDSREVHQMDEEGIKWVEPVGLIEVPGRQRTNLLVLPGRRPSRGSGISSPHHALMTAKETMASGTVILRGVKVAGRVMEYPLTMAPIGDDDEDGVGGGGIDRSRVSVDERAK